MQEQLLTEEQQEVKTQGDQIALLLRAVDNLQTKMLQMEITMEGLSANIRAMSSEVYGVR